ncbi:MAG: protein-glutamate O-methyltransferase CheR [Gemmatimonadetes bacterium]|nr:protein-glutamate O-methyltransferase CheR [Gemmatimonadota bacterium]
MGISPADFDFVRAIVRTDSAIVLEPGKEYLVESRLLSLARAEGAGSVDAVIDALRQRPTGELRYKVVEAMTTNETSFFRDITPFDALRLHIIPDLMSRRADRQQLRIWCGAASTGQEPYSLAMLLREHFPALHSWRVTITATDLSRTVLAKARAGRFSQLEVNRGLPAPLLVKYFEREGVAWRVKPVLRDMIAFREMNLVGPWTVPDADLILLRNVLIYFDVATKRQILGNLRRILSPNGYLLLGSAESTMNIDDTFRRVLVGRMTSYQPLTTRGQAA